MSASTRPKPSQDSSAPSAPPSAVSSSRHGGARQGAGRPAGSGRYGEPCVRLSVPQSKVDAVRTWLAAECAAGDDETISALLAKAGLHRLSPAEAPAALRLPLFAHKIAAGFPSPADDYVEDRLDLNEHLIRHKEASFFLRVQGESMLGAGIHDGDLLLVDRALTPVDGKIIIAVLDGELTVKRLQKKGDVLRLMPENPAFAPIEVGREQELVIWGVVTHVIHDV